MKSSKIQREGLLKNISAASETVNSAAKKMGVTAVRLGDSAVSAGNIAVHKMGDAAVKLGDAAVNAGNTTVQKMKDFDLSEVRIQPEDVITQAMKLPFVKIDRAQFLRKELIKYYPENIVQKAIEYNPAYAGIERAKINEIAEQVINYETNSVSAVSFAAGMPGGISIIATVPADIAQYFGFILRIMQKLAYLYGFEEFELKDDQISDDTMNRIMIFLGVMYGVQGATTGIRIIAKAAADKISKTLAQKALTKTAIYPIVKKIAQAVGITMTKQIFAESVSKAVPIVGGVVSGGLTYATFKPLSYNLQLDFRKLKLSDPKFYRKEKPVIDL